MVRLCRFGMWDETWDLKRRDNGSKRSISCTDRNGTD